MKDLKLRTIQGLSTDKVKVLEDKELNLYMLENGILYDAIIQDSSYKLSKGVSHRMSKLNLIID